jgi:hypothetical protein
VIYFDRYTHINELIQFYLNEAPNAEISRIMASDITTESDAEKFSHFIWEMVGKIHDDEDAERLVLGRPDNTDMLPDLSYEVTKYMRKSGFYNIWERVSDLDD